MQFGMTRDQADGEVRIWIVQLLVEAVFEGNSGCIACKAGCIHRYSGMRVKDVEPKLV